MLAATRHADYNRRVCTNKKVKAVILLQQRKRGVHLRH